MPFIKKNVKHAGYLISLCFLYLTFKDTDYGLVLQELKHFNIYCIMAAVIFNAGNFVIRGFYQINNLYNLKTDISFRNSFTSIGIAQLYNSILPARFGEVMRVLFLTKTEGIKKTSLLAYILIEKVMDMLVVMLVLSAVIITGFKNTQSAAAFTYSFAAILGVVISLFIYIRFNNCLMTLSERVLPESVRDFIVRANVGLIEGIRFFRSGGQIIRSVFLLLSSWVMTASVFWLVSYPYVKYLGLPSYSFLVFMVFAALSLSVPSAPAGIGVMHFGLFLGFKLLMKNTALQQTNTIAAATIFIHFFVVFTDAVLGLLIIMLYKLKTNNKLMPE